ncbi:MAG: SDR family oxidoreductase [Pseudomonadota bacterium]|jgi:3-oxoacyl-[acyl-carrier protein] reductase|nr:MAG: short-chain dehydrogenase [Pseudomonadota bacterium]
MDLGIRGRRAIVNGASAGMGRAAAEMLAMEGVDLVICARRRERLEQAAGELRRHGVSVTAVAADHSTEEGRAKVLAACPDPDILVATCSPPPLTPDHTAITPEQWRSALEIGLMSPVRFIEAVLPGMVKRRWGRIVNITTIAAKYPLELRILSGGPRAALANYTGAVARRVAPDNVTLNNVLPGMFHTAAVEAQFTAAAQRNGTTYEQEVAKFVEAYQIPAGRFGQPREVGSLVAWLCSEFAGYITGQNIVMDGATTRSTF